MFNIKQPGKIDKINVIYFISLTNRSQFLLRSITDYKKTITVLLILDDDQFNEVYNELEIEINQAVYFFKKSTKELFEQYTVNNERIENKLGNVIFDKFKWDPGIKSDFIKRRFVK